MISIEGFCCAAITPGQVTLSACALGKHRETLRVARGLYLDYVYHVSISPWPLRTLIINHLQRRCFRNFRRETLVGKVLAADPLLRRLEVSL
jgi:hypothetical protein